MHLHEIDNNGKLVLLVVREFPMNNPVFIARDNGTAYLFEAFQRLRDGAKLNRPMMPDGRGR